MKTKLTKRFWFTLVIFSLIGQVAWVVENMYFNVFIYKMFHATAGQISTMVAASAVAATVTTLVIGALSDKLGKRKIFICSGYILWGLSILTFAFIRMDVISQFIPNTIAAASVGVSLVIIMDCVMTFFGSSANDACFNAWITDVTDDTNRGSVEGINSMMPLVAILVVFGGFMFFDLDNQGSWVTIFLIIGIIVTCIGILGLFLIKDNHKKTNDKQKYFKNILYGFRISVIKENKILYTTLIAFAVFGISIQTYMPYLILYYEKSLGLSNYVMIMAPAIVLAAIVTAFYGRIYDKFEFKHSILPSISILLVGYILLYLFKGTGLVFVGSLLMMIGYLTGMAVFGAMIRDYTPVDKAGLFQGLRIIGQVFIPGIIGPALGAAVLAHAKTTLNSDGTTSFIPNENIFLAALIVALLIFIVLAFIFSLLKKEHIDLLTPEGENRSDKTWEEYPRPQLRRDSYINLNGIWEFELSKSENFPQNFTKQICVPFPPESILSGVHVIPGRKDYLYYRREFKLPENFKKDIVFLHFGAVDQECEVYINNEKVGSHSGGYCSFSIDITQNLQDTNILLVKVKDSLNKDLPYGKQRRKSGGMWYTPVSGIWQTVWLESVSMDYIRQIKITPNLKSVTIHVVSSASIKHLVIETEVKEIQKTFEGTEIVVEIEHPHYWTPEDPYLYEFTLSTNGDQIKSYFALRTLNIKKIQGIPRICLNEKPYFFHGLLDQGYYSDGIYLPASAEGYKKDILMMKELGFNTLRKHIKIEPDWYYYLCDCLGMIVFQDMVNNSEYQFVRDTALPTLGYRKYNDRKVKRSNAAKDNFIHFTKETIGHLYNHPSICYWTIFNEGWGQYNSDELYEMVKGLDKTRIIDSTSGWFKQKNSDVESLHVYFKPITFQAENVPVMVSEFGGYSYKIKEHSYGQNRNYGYRFFKKQKDFQQALVKLYEDEVINQIKDGLCGSIYTQVSDVEEETNGLVTYDRKVLKVDRQVMLEIADKIKFEINK